MDGPPANPPQCRLWVRVGARNAGRRRVSVEGRASATPPPPGYCGKVYPRKEHAEEASPPASPASTTLPANPTLLRRGVETGILAQRHRDVDRDLVQLATTAAASRGSERRNTSPRRRRRHKRQCPPVPADGDGRTGTRRLAGVEGGGRRAACGIRRDMRHDIAELRRDLSAQMATVNTRIDNILLAERRPSA